MKKYDAHYPQYTRLFRFFNIVCVVFGFIRCIPSYIWFILCWAYIQTVYRAYWKIQETRDLRRLLSR